MRIGTRLASVAVASCLVALATYGAWSLSLRREQLYRELDYEEQSLSTILRGALEAALGPERDVTDVHDVVEQLSSAERVHGIVVHGRDRGAVAMSDSVKALAGKVPADVIARTMEDGKDRELRLVADGHRFLVHLLPLVPHRGEVVGVAEVWRDLGYIDGYLRDSALRLIVLALVLGGTLSAVIALVTRRSITQPAAALIDAMEKVAAGDLSIRVAAGKAPPEGELGDIARAFDRLALGLEEAKGALEASVSERAALASRLRQSERLATLGQIVAEVAHELGTPLNVIAGRADETLSLARSTPAGDEKETLKIAADNAATVHEQSRRITRILQRLLHLAHERMPTLEPVPMRALAEKAAGFLAPEAAAAKVSIAVTGDESALARGEPDLLQQVLLNLLANALQASPANGTVRVEVARESGKILVRVRDEGPGVPASMLPNLFQAFATTKPPGKGTGLGLSISQSILRQLGGTLRYAGEPGTGAIFVVTLLDSTAAPATKEMA